MQHPRVRSSFLVLLALLVAPATNGCTTPGASASGEASCVGVLCSSHGQCVVLGGVAACHCDSGFVPQGLECLPAQGCDPNPCTAPHQTTCSLVGHQVVCLCDEGWHETPAGCEADADNACYPNPCTAPHRTACVVESGEARCKCDEGFEEDASGTCVSETPCLPNPCTTPHRTVCAEEGGDVSCACDPGYAEAENGDCLPVEPCDPNPCTTPHQTVCTVVGGQAYCSCDPGWKSDGAGGCVMESPCDPNPCTAPHQTTCSEVGGLPHCSCDPGYVDDGSGTCIIEPDPDCVIPHPDGDAYENDDCPHLANELVAGTPQNRTIDISGDVDWMTVSLQADHIYELEVFNLDAYIYLYDTDSTTLLASKDEPELISYAPTVTGVYYFKVRHYFSTSTGSYTVSLTDLGVDDSGDDPATALLLDLGTPFAGQLLPAGDNDWFKFDAVAGHTYEVTTSGADTYLYVYDTDGTTVLIQSDYPPLYVTAEGPGPYFVRVRHYSSSGTGSYTLTVTDLGTDDHGDDAASATPVIVGPAGMTGYLVPAGDNDWFRLDATTNHVYRITTTGTNTYLYLYDTDGTTILKETDYPPLYHYAAGPGPYYIRVRHSYSSTGSYTLIVEDQGPDDHGNDADHATLASTSGTGIAGVIEYPGDHDWFKFTGTELHLYSINTTGIDTYVSVYDTDGVTVLEEADAVPLIFTAPADAVYYVVVRHDSSTGTGSYTLTITDQGTDDYGSGAANAHLIVPEPPPGTPVPGRIEVGGDDDWFAFDATAGRIYRCTTTGIDTYVYLIDTDGVTVLKSQDDPTIIFTPQVGGRYYYKVRAYYASATGDYHVLITDEGTDDFPNGPVGAPTVPADGTSTPGSIQYPGDHDWVGFVAEANSTYVIDAPGLDGANTVVTLYSPDGATQLAEADTPPTITRTLSAAGTYFVRVRLYSSSATGDYTLTITKQ